MIHYQETALITKDEPNLDCIWYSQDKMQLDVDVSPPANIIKINYQSHMLANIFLASDFWSSLNFGQVTTDRQTDIHSYIHTESDA